MHTAGGRGEYFSFPEAAKQALTRLKPLAARYYGGAGDLQDPLAPEEVNRMRYAHAWSVPQSFLWAGPRFGRGLSLYLSAVPPPVRRELVAVLAELGVNNISSRDGLVAVLKALGDEAKKFGSSFSSNWRYFVNLETLGGYAPEQTVESQISDVRSWVTGTANHQSFNGLWSPEFFLEDFRAGVRAFLERAPSVPKANSHALTARQWVSDPLRWANSGATSFRRNVVVEQGGRERRVHRSKGTSGLLRSSEDVLDVLMNRRVCQQCKAIQKRETAKVRAVVNSDDDTYLQMAYVSHWLERALKHHPWTPLFMSLDERQAMWQNLSRGTAYMSFKVPLDQSHFDWQPNKSMIRVCVEEIERFVDSRVVGAAHDDLVRVTQRVLETLVVNPGVVKVGKESVPYQKGVLSGWRWTALLDTMCNVGELMAARALLKRLGIDDPVLGFFAQGDDDQVTCSSPVGAADLCMAYSIMGFELNPHKFFIDTERDEFLRRVVTPEGITGYPARAVNSILWRNPVNPDPLPGEAALRQQLKQWNLLYSRGCDSEWCFKHMLRDMCGRNGVSVEYVSRWLFTPAPFGGGGLVRDGSGSVEWLEMVERPSEIRPLRVVSALPGLAATVGFAKSRRISFDSDKILTGFLPRKGLDVTAARFELRPRQRVLPMTVGIGTKGFPHPVFREEVPLLLRSVIAEEAARNHDFGSLIPYLTEESVAVLNTLLAKATRRVIVEWVTGRLRLQSPTLWGSGSEFVANLWRLAAGGIWCSCLTAKRITSTCLASMAFGAVDNVRRMVLGLRPDSG